MAVPLAVDEVDDEADEQPDEEPHPVGVTESVNHGRAGHDPERRDQRHHRDAESPFQVGTAHPDDPDADANENEGEERSDAGHLAGNTGRNESRPARR